MKTSSQSDHFRAYNDYKNLYLKAIMEEDSNLRLSALQGIVRSGKKLHIDVEQYSKELKKLSTDKIYTTHNIKANLKKDKNKKIELKSSHKLKSVFWRDSKLVLKFDKELEKNQINYFTLHESESKVFRYIFDIEPSTLTKSQNLRKDGIRKIKLAQFKPDILRLVIENDSGTNVDFIKESDELVINIEKIKPMPAYQPPLKVDREKVIVIDAGHGGKDPGAVGYKKYREKVVVFKIAKELAKILKSRGYKVFMTRDRDRFVKLSKRTQYANEKSANIFVSIHANAVDKKNANSASGIECYFLSPSRSSRAKRVAAQENSADMSDMNMYGKDSYLNLLNHHNILASNKLAIDLQRGMLGLLSGKYKDVKDGGVREGPFWVLVGAQMPSVLVEVGFISNPKEAKMLVNNEYRKTMAQGMANGIERYFANN
ncbi:N-acetylmuramoyl-L-alanine amidase [Candidatus Sulfurimonas baltica]|nr:N-acetylmuramoyl-L-alanine amidase [Candidatus Sulfurimonas baltica]